MASTRYLSTTVVVALLFLSTCVSVILGSIAWSRSVSLFLPFPVSLSASGTLLPVLTIITLLTTNIVLSRRNRKRITASNGTSTSNNNINNDRPVTQSSTTTTIITFLIDQFFTLAPAVIATLAASYIFPSGSTADTCHLEETWQSYFRAKNADAIRTIQDALRCCGLRSIHDRAWPFKDATHGDDACAVQLGYRQSCLDPWSEVEKSTAWMVFVAAALAWLIKLGLTHFGPLHGTSPFDLPRGENQYRSNLWINGINGSSSIPRMLPYSDVPHADEHREDEDEEEGGRGNSNSHGRQNADNDGENHDNGYNNGQGNHGTGTVAGAGARPEYSDSSPWREE
ncbi:hypothetical protein VTN96DRAFT_31 [Rasamsonia emersonii]